MDGYDGELWTLSSLIFYINKQIRFQGSRIIFKVRIAFLSPILKVLVFKVDDDAIVIKSNGNSSLLHQRSMSSLLSFQYECKGRNILLN